jgi:formylglycine-generating enzyme
MTLRRAIASASLLLLVQGHALAAAAYVAIPGGELRTVLPPDAKDTPARVSPMLMRSMPVSNAEFMNFVAQNQQWRRDRTATSLADKSYLAHWAAPDSLGTQAQPDQPVTQVSWFAASAYCESEQGRLPLWHEWEWVAAADETRYDARADPAWRERILSWYARPGSSKLPPVGHTARNAYGIYDLHGVVWEWVEDHAGIMVSSDNREQGDPDLLKFCGAGALSVNDRENYAVLMRLALLSSLQAAQTTRNLGFRCVRESRETVK